MYICTKPSRALITVFLILVFANSGCAKQGPLIDIAGNTELPPAPDPIPGVDMSNFRMDTTVGTYGNGREDSLILVTIDLDKHRLLINDSNVATDGLPVRYSALMTEWSNQFKLNRVADWPVPPLGVSCLIFEVSANDNISTIVAALNQDPLVNTAQAVNSFRVMQDKYNDPYLPLQHAFYTMKANYTHQWATGRDVSVAVIDTGMDTGNREFEKRIKGVKNFVDSNGNLFRKDVHGTAVAGLIAAAANNKTGMVGIAPRAQLLPYKACWQQGADGRNASCNSITLLKALDTAIQENVDVINLSLAGPRDALLEQLIAEAQKRNIIVVGARSPDNPNLFPAAVPGTIAVSGQTDTTDGIVKAPGQKVLSLHPRDGYKFYNGSSFATAHVAGVVALIRELAPDWTSEDITALLIATADANTGSANACRAISVMVKTDTGLCN